MFDFFKKPENEKPSLSEGRLMREAGEAEPEQVFAGRQERYRKEIEDALMVLGISVVDAVGNEMAVQKIAVNTSASDKEVAEMLKIILAEERNRNRKKAA